jgi:4-amino-4-deoxy-L-arabinose transferase-like glycosyltransferase
MLDRPARHTYWQLALVVLVAACVYLPFLGARPLDFSEGHRAVPGWTMLESRDFWHQKMFGLTYIRKPPGMAWAIAASSAWLGQTPFAARLPNALGAILMSGIAWWYGRRWFGGSGATLAGVGAGLAQALMPLMWSPGRTAEIEMLNNLGTQMFALGLVDLLMGGSSRGGEVVLRRVEGDAPLGFLGELCASAMGVLVPAAGLVIAALAKGPASAPVLGGVMVGACVAARSIRPLRNGSLWVVFVFGAGAIALLGMRFLIANDDPGAVREDVAGQFLWSGARVTGVLTLLPLAFASALPVSLALLVPFMRNARGRAGADASNHPGEDALARTLAWAWLCSVGTLMLVGVSAPRYAMPAAALLPPLVPPAMAALRRRLAAADPARAARPGRGLALLGSARVWFGAMLMGAWWFLAFTAIAPTEDQKAGIAAAKRLVEHIDRGELWADDAVEARPDMLWNMQVHRPGLRVRWAKGPMRSGDLPGPMSLVVLRTDDGSSEAARYAPRILDKTLVAIDSAEIRRYRFTVYQVQSPRP